MKKLSLIFCLFLFFGCTAEAQILKKAKGLLGGDTPFTEEEAANALKEALSQGTSKGVDLLSKADGYYKNPEIKIPFPKEAEVVEPSL